MSISTILATLTVRRSLVEVHDSIFDNFEKIVEAVSNRTTIISLLHEVLIG